jgi:hypothetical protein
LKLITITCEYCGDEKDVQAAKPQKYCSRGCVGKANQARVLKNRPVIDTLDADGFHQLPLNDGTPVKVSPEDYEWALTFSWHRASYGYAASQTRRQRPGKKRSIRMHRAILERKLSRPLLPTERPDHINHQPLDNRRENLRLASFQQNNMNASPYNVRGGTSDYKGVFWDKQKNRWRANIRLSGVRIYCGSSEDELEAAYLYDQFALALFDEYAYLNVLDHA